MAERRSEGGALHINATGKITSKCMGDYIMNIVHIGNDRPSLKDLHDHVVMKVADRWKDLGVQLLRSDQEKMLDIIEADHPHDAVRCCKCLFKKWVDATEDARWNVLIKALKGPSVQLDYLAGQLEKMLIIERKYKSQVLQGVFLVWCSQPFLKIQGSGLPSIAHSCN